MAINITIDNDLATAGIQTLVNDQSAGTQTLLTADTGNDSDLTVTADGTVGSPDSNPFDTSLNGGAGYSAAFLGFLNASTIFGSAGLRLNDAEKAFAANVEGAVSSSSFVTVTATANETINDLFFSDSSGNALNGQQVAGMTTLDGSNVYLWSNGDFAIATTSATAGAGRVVAAFHLNEAANHLSAQVEMATFEALNHPVAGSTAAAYDDALNFTDVLQVSAAGSVSFNFDNLPSGSFLYAAVGTSSVGLLVTGQDLNVNDTAGSKLGDLVTGGSDPSDTVNTSQGGIGATIGINSQHFTDVSGGGSRSDGAVGVFTLVKGFGSFDATINGTSEGTGTNVNEITYTDYVNAPSASIFISQSTGSSSIGGAVRVTLWEAGGGALTSSGGTPLPAPDHAPADLKPEVGYADTAGTFSYIGNQDTDSHLKDDTPVAVGSVTVKHGANIYTWTSANSGAVQGTSIKVTISGNTITVQGLSTADTLGFTAANDPNNALDGTFNRFDVQALANSNPVDIGRIDLSQGVSVSHGVGSDLIVQDDGPNVAPTLNANATVDLDESGPSAVPALDTGAIVKGADPDNPGPGAALNAANSGTAVVDPHAAFGTDGPAASGSLTYALSLGSITSGVTLTDGTAISLQQLANGNIVGVVQGSGTFAGQAAFAVSINASTGVVSVEQYLSLHQNTADTNGDSNEFVQAALNSIGVTVTAKDGDGDSNTSTAVDISHQISFHDDGPTVAPTLNANATISIDESGPAAASTIAFAGITQGDDPDVTGSGAIARGVSGGAVVDAHAAFGADGAATSGSLSYALSLSASSVSSGLTTTDGAAINLQNVGGVVVGVVATGAFAGQAALAIAIDSATGVVTLEQYLSLHHGSADAPTDSDEAVQMALGSVGVTVTATDGDADSKTSGAVDISQLLSFHDDGPTISASAVNAPTISDDESNLLVDNSASYAGQFTKAFGADGPAGSGSLGYALSTQGGASGLIDTATGQSVVLSLVGGQIVGKTATSGVTVFVVSVDASGNVTLDQQRAVIHANPNDPNDSTGLTGVNKVVLTATVTDGDGDHAPASLDLTPLLSFADDGPSLGPISNGLVSFATGATGTVTNSLNGAVGADVNGVPYALVAPYTTSITVNGTVLNAVASANGQQISYWADTNHDTIFGNTGDTEFYRLTLNETANSGAGSYTFTVLVNPPPAFQEFNFNNLPSGQNLFGTVGTTSSALVVIGGHPVLNTDGSFANASDTINTSQGGGAVTIGVNNQMFDANESAYFTFVKNPVASFLSGAPGGLDQNEADNANNIQYTGGTTETNSAFLKVVQIQGNVLGSMDIAASNIAGSPQGTSFVSALGSGSAVAITAVRVLDSLGNLLEKTTGNGDGGMSSTITITISNGVAHVSGVGAGEKVAWDTSANFDQVKVTDTAGKFDIGGFGILQGQDTPDQLLHFTAKVTDGDGDNSTAAWSIGIDGTGINHDGMVLGL